MLYVCAFIVDKVKNYEIDFEFFHQELRSRNINVVTYFKARKRQSQNRVIQMDEVTRKPVFYIVKRLRLFCILIIPKIFSLKSKFENKFNVPVQSPFSTWPIPSRSPPFRTVARPRTFLFSPILA